MAQETKRLTYRASGLPPLVDEVGACEILREYLDQSKGDSEDCIHIQVLSLARSLHVSTEGTTKKATVTVDPPQRILQNKLHFSSTWRGTEYSVTIDRDFLGFTVLNDVHDDELLLNCVAISGLASHPFGSWQQRQDRHGTSFMWLRDELPKDLQRTRVITYGYDTQLDTTSFQNIEDLATAFRNKLRAFGFESASSKPIVFLAHSLGGIILKQLFIQAMRASAPILLTNTKACMCFGVPNLGLTVDQLTTLIRGYPTEDLVHDLSVESRELGEIDRQFKKLQGAQGLYIVSFYETKMTKTVRQSNDGIWSRCGPEVIMVKKESAIMSCSRDVHPINKDHSAMVKFESNDEDYTIVRSHLQEILMELVQDEARKAPPVARAPLKPLAYSLCKETNAITFLGYQANTFDWDKFRSIENLQISFRRTVRAHENGTIIDRPPDRGAFPVYDTKKYPEYFRSHNGYFIPMYQREAFWIKLSSKSPYAMKVYLGGINAISGEPKDETEATHIRRLLLGAREKPIQDYVVTPEQKAIYGIAHQDDSARQFVAMPTASGYSVEVQLTREEIFRGLQIEVTPTYAPVDALPGPWPIVVKSPYGNSHIVQVRPENTIEEVKHLLHDTTEIPFDLQRLIFSGKVLEDDRTLSDYNIRMNSCLYLVLRGRGGGGLEYDESMNVAVSGCIKQVIHTDWSDRHTWDSSRTTSVDIQLLDCKAFRSVTGLDPPEPPISAIDYRELGYPYQERSNKATGELNRMFTDVKPVNKIDKERLRTQISEDAIRQLEMAVDIRSSSQEAREFRHRRKLEGEVERALGAPNLKRGLWDAHGAKFEAFPLARPRYRRGARGAEDGRAGKRNTNEPCDDGRESTLYRWLRKVFHRRPRTIVMGRDRRIKRMN